jgi:hypothetical protein
MGPIVTPFYSIPPFSFSITPLFPSQLFVFSIFLFAPGFSKITRIHKLKSLSRDIYSPEDEGKKPGRIMMQIPRFANLFATSNLPNLALSSVRKIEFQEILVLTNSNLCACWKCNHFSMEDGPRAPAKYRSRIYAKSVTHNLGTFSDGRFTSAYLLSRIGVFPPA